MTNLPPITNKQSEILKLLYRHRFLNREQIQFFLRHKDKVRTHLWLKDLKEKQYIQWIYDANDFVSKTKPAVYYLGINGIRYLRNLEEYPVAELRKRYAESKRKQAFIDHCLLLAECCINALSVRTDKVSFSYVLPADFTDPDSRYQFLEELKPQACFIKQQDGELNTYILEIFEPSLPRYLLRKRIKDYITFLDEEIWQDETEDDEPPIVQLAFATKSDLLYAKRRAKLELAELYDDELPKESRLRFTTIDRIKEQGFTSKIWEKLNVGKTN
jgi:hypothetical protein